MLEILISSVFFGKNNVKNLTKKLLVIRAGLLKILVPVPVSSSKMMNKSP